MKVARSSLLLFALFLLLGTITSEVSFARSQLKRSSAARNQFMKLNPCSSTGKSSGACPGHVIDHVIPLKRGGFDIPSNMQWQTKEEAEAKDKWE